MQKVLTEDTIKLLGPIVYVVKTPLTQEMVVRLPGGSLPGLASWMSKASKVMRFLL